MNNSSLSNDMAPIGRRIAKASIAGFHAYANWLVSIGWWRFFGLSIVLLIAMGIIHNLPPLSWTYTEVITSTQPDKPTTPPRKPEKPAVPKKQKHPGSDGVDISIDEHGVTIKPRAPASAPAVPASEAASSAAGAPVPPSAPAEVADADAARPSSSADSEKTAGSVRTRTVTYTYGDPVMPLTLWFIFLSAIVKIAYKGKVQAEEKAALATRLAEAESLKRQVVEARMAAMQAQVEPHFLFNTLASIDHLIETDPPRASAMQKNLIALLRASMPSMREVNAQATRDLGQELAVIRPYLEILKMRMEERLQTEVRVSEGLLSAEFPPMMLQSLVENAIKHGLEPKAEGGQITISAEIVHGKLAVTVADTGLGFGKADTAGTGIGLSNIRERLALHYGSAASLVIAPAAGGGTSITITIPYVSRAA